VTCEYGVLWTQTSAPIGDGWTSIACDSTGQYLVAASLSGYIFTSTNGIIYITLSLLLFNNSLLLLGGMNWNQTSAPLLTWSFLESDSTGLNLAAGANGYENGQNQGRIYTSTDGITLLLINCFFTIIFIQGGGSWSQTSARSDYWIPLSSDSTGMKLVYGQWLPTSNGPIAGSIYISSNG